MSEFTINTFNRNHFLSSSGNDTCGTFLRQARWFNFHCVFVFFILWVFAASLVCDVTLCTLPDRNAACIWLWLSFYMKRFLFTMSDNALLVGLLSRLRKGGREYTAFPVCQMYVFIYKYNGLCKRDGCLVIR